MNTDEMNRSTEPVRWDKCLILLLILLFEVSFAACRINPQTNAPVRVIIPFSTASSTATSESDPVDIDGVFFPPPPVGTTEEMLYVITPKAIALLIQTATSIPTNTPDVAVQAMERAEREATAVAATLTALAPSTNTPTLSPTPDQDATVAAAVAATVAAQPTPTPNATETRLALNRAIELTLTAQPTPTSLPTRNLVAPVATATPIPVPTKVPSSSNLPLRIVYANGPVADSDLRVADVESGDVYTIAQMSCDEAEPAWSPNGVHIVYHADCNESYDIYRVNSDGSSTTRLTTTSDIDEREPEYSPDGSQIIYRANLRKETKTNAVGELWIMNADGSSQFGLGVIGRAPSWSPDGTRIAYMANHDGVWNIYVYTLATGNINQITRCSTNCRWPAWSPDSRELVYNTTTKATNTAADALWVISATGGIASRLTSDVGAGRPSWSSTGLIAFSSDRGIEYMQEDGRNRTTLIPDYENWAPHWSK